MTIFHDKLGNRLAMTETDALALGYTYEHKGLKMSEKVNQECSSMTANKLADDLDNANGFQYVAQLGLASQAATMLRQQQVRIKQLEETQEYLYKTHDKDKSEIEALKKRLENPVGAFGIERAYEAGKQTAQAEIADKKLVNDTFADLIKKQGKKIDEQQSEIEALKSVVYWLKENRPEVWDDIQKWRKQ